MERDAFNLLAAAERDHWWFRGRRHFIASAIRSLTLVPNASVLDAGCGSGGNLELLAQFGHVRGFEFDAVARTIAQELGIAEIRAGELPDTIPFSDVQFDLIGLFDVLEHLAQPVASLQALRSRTAPGGAIVITVPALPWLWGPHDEIHSHQRRYTATVLREHLNAAGWRVQYLSYFNMLLLPLAMMQRLRERIFGYRVGALYPSTALNRLLFAIWRIESLWIPKHRLPIGLSLLAIARRVDSPT